MFVLDTNILSATMAANPASEVAAFVSGQPAELLSAASICQAEILSCIAIMPEGRRRLDLEAAARAMFLEDFERCVLPFDTEAAIAYADIFTARRRARRHLCLLNRPAPRSETFCTISTWQPNSPLVSTPRPFTTICARSMP